MWKALIVTALIAMAAVPTASAAADICTKFHVCTKCDGNGVCVVVWRDATGVCGGVGFGLQGVGACANSPAGCATVIFGFNRESVCTTFSLP